MSALTIDTLAVSQPLRKRGFTEEQSIGVVEALRETDASELATKGDLRELEAEVDAKLDRLDTKVEISTRDLKIWFGSVIVVAVGVILAAIRYRPAAH